MSTTKTPQLHLQNQVCFQLYSLSRKVTQAYQPLLKPLGLTYPQYLVMLVLWQKDESSAEQADLPCAIKDITEPLMLDTGTVTPLLKRMEERSLLERVKSQHDSRKVLVDLTEQGRALKLQAASVPVELLCSMDVQQEKFIGLHQKLAAILAELES